MTKKQKVNAKKASKLTALSDSDLNASPARLKRPGRPCARVGCKRQNRRKLGSKYCCDACKSAARRKAHRKDPQVRVADSYPLTCANPRCKADFWAALPSQVYCCASCRVIACRLKREKTLETVSFLFQIPQNKVADVLEVKDLRAVSAVLQSMGLQYDRLQIRWA